MSLLFVEGNARRGCVEDLSDASYEEVSSYRAAPNTAFAGVNLPFFGGKESIGASWVKL
jgi:hypothetical protein